MILIATGSSLRQRPRYERYFGLAVVDVKTLLGMRPLPPEKGKQPKYIVAIATCTIFFGNGTSRVFDFPIFFGTWALRRNITNGCSMSGEAVLAPDRYGARYSERGVLSTPDGQSFDATRQYFFNWSNSDLSVFFDEQRTSLFLGLEIRREEAGSIGSGIHFCGADTYKSTYRFIDPQRFDMVHDVTGPKKSYISTTTFRREL